MVDKDHDSRKRNISHNKPMFGDINGQCSGQQTVGGREVNSSSPDNNMNGGYRNAREYAQAVRRWLWHYHCWASMNNFMAMMPLYAMSCPPPTGVMGAFHTAGQYTALGTSHGNTYQSVPQQGHTQQGQRSGVRAGQRQQGREYLLPSFWKRVAAELIDFTLLFYIKLVVTVIVMRELGYMDGSLDYNMFFDLEEMDYDKAFAITSEVIAMEVVNRLLITVFETLCLRRGIGVVGGSTPGKRLLGLRVVSCSDIVDLGNNRILVYPAQNIGWASAFVRSVIKNFTIAFFFPACLTVFFFKYSRAAYDVLSSTIVVQSVEADEMQ